MKWDYNRVLSTMYKAALDHLHVSTTSVLTQVEISLYLSIYIYVFESNEFSAITYFTRYISLLDEV